MRQLIDSDWLADYLKGRSPCRALLNALECSWCQERRFSEMFRPLGVGQDSRGK